MTDAGNYLLAMRENAESDAMTLEAEAEALEAKAHDLRDRAAKLRACARTLGRFG